MRRVLSVTFREKGLHVGYLRLLACDGVGLRARDARRPLKSCVRSKRLVARLVRATWRIAGVTIAPRRAASHLQRLAPAGPQDRKSTRLNSSH